MFLDIVQDRAAGMPGTLIGIVRNPQLDLWQDVPGSSDKKCPHGGS
jgi:hypothetical protein